ncbi:hypothetical protein XENOCAPTIV_001109, partial [Xenoophorus captivus]
GTVLLVYLHAEEHMLMLFTPSASWWICSRCKDVFKSRQQESVLQDDTSVGQAAHTAGPACTLWWKTVMAAVSTGGDMLIILLSLLKVGDWRTAGRHDFSVFVLNIQAVKHKFKCKERTYPELDEEIDFLSAIISEQRTESRMPAPPSQYFKLKKLIEPSSVHRGSPTEQPTSLSNLLNTTTLPSTTNHTPGLLGDPLIIAYPSNDHVFISKSLC